MLRTVLIAAGAMLAAPLAAGMFCTQASAQGSPWCSGQVVIRNGQAVATNFTPPGPGEPSTGRGWSGADPNLAPDGAGPGGIADTCEILSTPAGLMLQNGGSTTNPRDGQNAQHEATGHSPGGGSR